MCEHARWWMDCPFCNNKCCSECIHNVLMVRYSSDGQEEDNGIISKCNLCVNKPYFDPYRKLYWYIDSELINGKWEKCANVNK